MNNNKTENKTAKCDCESYQGASCAKCQPRHTPGPWQVAGFGRVYGPGLPDTADHRLPTAQHIATMNCTVTRSEGSPFAVDELARANARLIAAAPDLLAALIAVRGLIDSKVNTLDGGANFYATAADTLNRLSKMGPAIDAAIAKAEGR